MSPIFPKVLKQTLGLFYVGERQTDLANTFQLDDYLRTDAALYYRRGRLNAAINIRNLFNVDSAVNGFDASAGFGTIFNRIAPFTIVGSLRWEF